MTVGSVWESNGYGEFEVISHNGSKNITVKFIGTGFVINTNSSNLMAGKVKDRLARSVFGVGFVGDGPFKSRSKGKADPSYVLWVGMIKRCYDKKMQESSPTYIGCTVCEEWNNYQNFAEWYNDNHPKDGMCYELDKDLKYIGNKLYSPKTCIFVPRIVNTFTLDCGASRGDFAIGVCFNKRFNKFQSNCRNPFTGKMEYLGLYTDEMSAHIAWRKRKSELAYELAINQDQDGVKQVLIGWRDALNSNLIHSY